jgi:hypothetical protein
MQWVRPLRSSTTWRSIIVFFFFFFSLTHKHTQSICNLLYVCVCVMETVVEG